MPSVVVDLLGHKIMASTGGMQADSRAAELLVALNLPIPVLDALIAASHTNPRLLNKRLETLGVAKMGCRLQLARALKEHAQGRTMLPAGLFQPAGEEDGPVLQENVSPPCSPLPQPQTYEPTSPTAPSPNAAIAAAAAVGCASPTASLIRAYVSTPDPSPLTVAPTPTPMANRTNLSSAESRALGSTEPRTRKSPNTSLGSTEPRTRKSPNTSRGRGNKAARAASKSCSPPLDTVASWASALQHEAATSPAVPFSTATALASSVSTRRAAQSLHATIGEIIWAALLALLTLVGALVGTVEKRFSARRTVSPWPMRMTLRP